MKEILNRSCFTARTYAYMSDVKIGLLGVERQCSWSEGALNRHVYLPVCVHASLMALFISFAGKGKHARLFEGIIR